MTCSGNFPNADKIRILARIYRKALQESVLSPMPQYAMEKVGRAADLLSCVVQSPRDVAFYRAYMAECDGVFGSEGRPLNFGVAGLTSLYEWDILDALDEGRAPEPEVMWILFDRAKSDRRAFVVASYLASRIDVDGPYSLPIVRAFVAWKAGGGKPRRPRGGKAYAARDWALCEIADAIRRSAPDMPIKGGEGSASENVCSLIEEALREVGVKHVRAGAIYKAIGKGKPSVHALED